MDTERRHTSSGGDCLRDARHEEEGVTPGARGGGTMGPRLADILRATTEHAIITTDTAGVITLFNAGAERMLGYQAAEVIGTHTLLAFHDPAEVAARTAERGLAPGCEVLLAAARQSETEAREWTYVRNDGSRLTVSLTLAGLWDEHAQLTGFIAIAQDITERVRAEEALRATELRCRSAIQLAPDAIISADDRGTIISWNSGAQRMFGYTAEEVVGQNLTILMPERLRAAHQQGLDRATAGGRLRHGGRPLALHALRKDGTIFPMELSLTTWSIAGRGFYSGIIRDTTDRERAEEQRADLLARERAARMEAETNAGMVRSLQAISDTALSHVALEDLLPELLDRLRTALGADTAAILLLDGDDLVMRMARGLEAEIPRGVRIPLGRGFAGRVAAGRRSLIVDDVTGFDLHTPFLRQQGVRSLLGTPLLLNGEVIGVARVGTLQPRHFSEQDAGLLELAATRIAVAIDRARLREAEQAAQAAVEASQRGIAFLAKASQEFTASLDYGITLQRVADLVVPTLADACIVEIATEDASLHQRAVSHVDAEKKQLLQELRRQYPLTMRELYPITKGVLATGRPHLSSELSDAPLLSVARDPEHTKLLRALGVTSVIVVPLVARRQTLGVVSLFSTQTRRRFGPADLTLAQALASRAALAIDNARLYREAQQALGRERILRSQAERMAAERTAVLGQIADGVVIVDRDGRITFANAVARRHFGFSTLGISIEDYARLRHLSRRDGRPWAPDDLPLARAIAHGEAVIEAEVRAQPPGGQPIDELVSATPVLSEDGVRFGAVMILHDVSAQRALDRQKDEFFANISHDLRTPLTAIMTSIGVVLANEPPDISAPLHRMLVNVEHAADRMAVLVENLLELTRLQAGRAHLQLERSDMRDLVRRTIAAIEPLAQARGQRVELELPAEPVEARVDVQRLERALLNLLSNAQKYGPGGGTIRVRLERRSDEVAFAVTDDGPGIAAADQQHLFERYYRPAVESSRRNQGSGLGLPITRAMVELHGGRIWVDSTPGAGATFWIVLPTTPPVAEQDREQADETPDR